MRLPEAYRSLSRPSSAPDAKAFTLCSLSLDLELSLCDVPSMSNFDGLLNLLIDLSVLKFLIFLVSRYLIEIAVFYPTLVR